MNSDMNLSLAKNLKSLLRAHDLTVAQLSRATEIPAQTLNNWLSGLEPRSIQQLKKVADYFDVSLDEITYGIKPSAPAAPIKIEDHRDEILAGNFEVVLRRIKK